MKLRLVGIQPLVGIEFRHFYLGSDPVPNAPCETCDGCGKPILARNIYFDGERFLCAGCRKDKVAQTTARVKASCDANMPPHPSLGTTDRNLTPG